eukprot:SAG31_NODE_5250_length_2650_cov_2.135241_3_plen_127_part_01
MPEPEPEPELTAGSRGSSQAADLAAAGPSLRPAAPNRVGEGIRAETIDALWSTIGIEITGELQAIGLGGEAEARSAMAAGHLTPSSAVDFLLAGPPPPPAPCQVVTHEELSPIFTFGVIADVQYADL